MAQLYQKVWLPSYRWQLIDWLTKRYPNDKAKFKRMRIKQLRAIYFSIRKVGKVDWNSY